MVFLSLFAHFERRLAFLSLSLITILIGRMLFPSLSLKYLIIVTSLLSLFLLLTLSVSKKEKLFLIFWVFLGIGWGIFIDSNYHPKNSKEGNIPLVLTELKHYQIHKYKRVKKSKHLSRKAKKTLKQSNKKIKQPEKPLIINIGKDSTFLDLKGVSFYGYLPSFPHTKIKVNIWGYFDSLYKGESIEIKQINSVVYNLKKSKNNYPLINLYSNKIKIKPASNPFIKFRLLAYRQVYQYIYNIFSARGRGLALALLLGDRKELHYSLKENFKKSGLSYLLALSGFHVSFFSLVLLLFFKLIMGYNRSLVFVMVILIGYLLLTGFLPSLTRAIIMFFVALLFFKIGRFSLLLILMSSFLIHMILFPSDFYQFSFQLSYLAMLGIALYSKRFFFFINRLLGALFYLFKSYFQKRRAFKIGQQERMIEFQIVKGVNRVGNFLKSKLFKFLIKISYAATFSIAISLSADFLLSPLLIQVFRELHPFSIISGLIISILVIFIMVIFLTIITVHLLGLSFFYSLLDNILEFFWKILEFMLRWSSSGQVWHFTTKSDYILYIIITAFFLWVGYFNECNRLVVFSKSKRNKRVS